MTKKIHAADLLKEIVKKRNWHQGKFPANVASNYKAGLEKGGNRKISADKAVEILEKLGCSVAEPEVWVIPDELM